jgi:hypothetical protein
MIEKIKEFKYPFYFFLISLLVSAMFLNQEFTINEFADYEYGPYPGEPREICDLKEPTSEILRDAVGLFIWGYISWYILNEFEKNKNKKQSSN